MNLRHFTIKSYRSCLITSFPVQDELTCLIGINGSGKSNILNSITLLKKVSRARPPTRDIDTSSINVCSVVADIEYQGKTLYIRGKLRYETDERNYDEVYISDLMFNFREFINNSKWVRFPIHFFGLQPSFFTKEWLMDSSSRHQYLRFFLTDSDAKIVKSKIVRELLAEVSILFDGINYYSASQFSDPSRCPAYIEFEENRPIRKPSREFHHQQFLINLYTSFKAQDIQYRRYINTVGNDGIGLLDNIDFKEMEFPSSYYEVKAGGQIHKIEKNRLLVVPRFTINNNELSPNQLSEGTFKTLALIFYILNDDSKLLLIEEPEVCVHHGLLSSVISLIKTQSKTKQIVMSTHSDFVLDHLKPENLLLVEYLQAKGTVAKPLNQSMGKNDFQALRDYLEEAGNLGEYWRESGFDNA